VERLRAEETKELRAAKRNSGDIDGGVLKDLGRQPNSSASLLFVRRRIREAKENKSKKRAKRTIT